jgi:hypothetical protein
MGVADAGAPEASTADAEGGTAGRCGDAGEAPDCNDGNDCAVDACVIKPPVQGDLNEDGCVNTLDSDIFMASYGYSVASGRADARADFNKDGWVDDVDYLVVQLHWGEGC